MSECSIHESCAENSSVSQDNSEGEYNRAAMSQHASVVSEHSTCEHLRAASEDLTTSSDGAT